MKPPLSMTETLKDFVSRVDQLGISYMITGSVAMSVYAPARVTMDIDVVIEIGPADAERFAARFRDSYYADRDSIRRAIERGSMFNIIDQRQGVKVDCIPRKKDPYSIQRFGRRILASIDDVQCWCITKEDLILATLLWARESYSEVQFRDISNLAESGYDEDYVRSWTNKLALHDTWSALEQWKIQAAK